MYSKQFWKAAFERTVKTAAQALLALIVVDGFAVDDLAAAATWSVVGLAALASVLTSVISGAGNGNPSVGNVERVKPRTPDYSK